MVNRMNKLEQKIGDLYKKLENINNKIDKYCSENAYMPCPENFEKVKSDILIAIDQYESKLFSLQNNPELSDNNIDLYLKNDNDSYSHYIIFLHDTDIYIGEINYQKNQPFKEKFGNISYRIFPEYRGNHYALSALNLMSDKLYKDGIEEIFLATERTNIPSLKTIERYGGELISSGELVVSYRCNLSAIKKQTNTR